MKLGLPLQPGRRQCVGNGELPALFLNWVFQFWREYSVQGTPRFGLLNLMSAHEHFMTRLATLDDQLRSFILHIEAHLRRDSALFLLSDHGTHGIWWASPHTSAAPHGPHPPNEWLPLTRATPCGPHLSSSSLRALQVQRLCGRPSGAPFSCSLPHLAGILRRRQPQDRRGSSAKQTSTSDGVRHTCHAAPPGCVASNANACRGGDLPLC